MSVADRLEPLYEAVIVTDCEKTTIDVFTVKVTLVAPAGTVTLAGTEATDGLLLESATCAPPAGAGAVNRTGPGGVLSPPPPLGRIRAGGGRGGGGHGGGGRGGARPPGGGGGGAGAAG